MSEILFLSHRIPFPPDRGDKIRSHHILRRLARIAPVHVATFADDDADAEAEGDLAHIASSHCLVRRTKPLPLAALEALAGSRPVSLTAFRSGAIESYVRQTLARRPIGLIYVFSGQMGQYVPTSYPSRVVADFVDVDSAKFEAYAVRDGGLRGWMEAREARLMRGEELRLARRAGVSLLISDEEAQLFRSRLPLAERARIAVRTLANGIDSATFAPYLTAPEPRMAPMPAPRLVFTGQMDYAPNVEACLRAVRGILPGIRARFPHASFHVVGRNPPERLTSLSGRDGVNVWGRVPDVRPYLAAADVALIPLDIGRGVQNKVLEAMAMALPVVLTPEAATGIGARDGRELLLGHGDADLVEACCALVKDRARAKAMGEAARRFVVSQASWEAALAELPEIVGFSGGTARDAA